MRGLEDFRFGIDSTDKSRGGYHQEILGHFTEQGKQYDAERTGIFEGVWTASFQVYEC